MLIHRCTRELLADQIGRFSERARAAGVEVQTVDHAWLWHSGQMLAGMLREATDAVHDIGVFLRGHLDRPQILLDQQQVVAARATTTDC